MREPFWMLEARRYLGVAEVKGPHHSPAILKLLDEADGVVGDGKTLQGIRDDETPWCAVFVSGVLEGADIRSTRSAWAKSYLTYGTELKEPALGAIAVFQRGNGGGHVGFVAGRYADGSIAVLGGNQSDSVRISKFNTREPKLLSYRWPSGFNPPEATGMNALPLLDAEGKPASAGDLA